MFAPGKFPFDFGDIGKCLTEKAQRNEPCSLCGNPVNIGQEVWVGGCNHVSHCFHGHQKSRSCKEEHILDTRYLIRTLVQKKSDLPKKMRRGARRPEAPVDTKKKKEKGPVSLSKILNKFPVIPQARLRQILGVGTSTAPPPPPEAQPPISEYTCCSCRASLRTDRAIYRHKKCNRVFDFKCLKLDPRFCPCCKEPLKNAFERIDHDL